MRKKNILQAEELEDATLQYEANPRRRILVVDDDSDIRRLNTELLASSGYHVDSAEDGAVAWDTLQQNGYDLLLTDHNMPKLSGIGLLKKLHAARMAIPVILVTGEPPTEELARHPWLQIEAMLLKPYAADELLAVVRNVLIAVDSAAQQIALPTEWQSESLPNRLQL